MALEISNAIIESENGDSHMEWRNAVARILAELDAQAVKREEGLRSWNPPDRDYWLGEAQGWESARQLVAKMASDFDFEFVATGEIAPADRQLT